MSLAFVATVVLLAAGAAVAAPAPETVRIDAGRVAGAIEDGVLAFKGIPFAAPPVDDLRWRPPQPVKPWIGVRPAIDYGHDCMQYPSDAGAPLRTTPSEDCLVTNVWRPAKAAPRKLPVMVWIHGGAFVNGGSSPAVFSGEAFARRGVVFVSFNYRLGRFGFFGFPALTREHPDEPKGNYGYMDQIAALKWIKRNIAAFGGDPSNVTLFGESAGGASVHALVTSPVAQGLFQKAIVQSGGGRAPLLGGRRLLEDLPGAPSAETIGVDFARAHGIEGSDAAALVQLRALSADDVTDKLDMRSLDRDARTYGGPMIDGRIVVESPEDAYRSGRFGRVSMITGATSDDLGFGGAASKEALFDSFGPAKAQAMAAFDPDGSASPSALNRAIARDRTMIEPARFAASAVAARGLPAYTFRFSYVARAMQTKLKSGAPHASEIPFVFDTLTARFGAKLTPEDTVVARAANAYWVNFARTGDPNGPSLPTWPRYSEQDGQLLDFRADGSVAGGRDPLEAQLDAVAAAADVAR